MQLRQECSVSATEQWIVLETKKHLTHGDAISTLRTYQSAIAYQSTFLARKEPKCPHACDGLKSTLLWKAGVDQQLHFHMDMRDGGRASELDSLMAARGICLY